MLDCHSAKRYAGTHNMRFVAFLQTAVRKRRKISRYIIYMQRGKFIAVKLIFVIAFTLEC